jgi:hypothetical protein
MDTVQERVHEEVRESEEWLGEVQPGSPADVLKPLLPFAAAVALAFLLHRLRGENTARSRKDKLRAAAGRVGEEIAERAWTLGRDAKVEARKQRAWNLLQGAVGAGFTLLARRAASGAFEALTGTPPPRRS